MIAGAASAVLAATGLAACSSANAGTGPVTLTYYLYPDTSKATSTAISNCDKASGGKYTISYQQLPQAADGQRQQLVRRLAAHDDTIDIMGLDVTWEAEFATAGWIEPWTGTYKAQAVAGTLVPALNTAIWKGKLYAVPDNTNTQLLWYRSDLVPKPPATWAEMIADAEQLAKQGKPHYIEIQGAQYEGATVWFNTMVSSAGGTVLNPDATKITLGAPAVKALTIMKQLATSTAADPSMSVQKENENRLQWALYPSVNPGQPAKVTIGGIDLAVSSYSRHKDLAFQAALCLRNRENQLIGANVGGVPPTIASLYNDPKLFANYPFHADILKALQNASVRPKTPVYQVVSIDISHQISPASSINPTSTLQGMKGSLSNALQSKGLVP
jgi:multiple sugar transport system substrate-binding protein